MTISLLRPWWDSGVPERERNRQWTRGLWQVLLPDAEVIEGPGGSDRVCRSEAINWCHQRATGDLYVIADVDAWVDSEPLAWALNEAQRKPGLVFPFTYAQMLSQEATGQVIETGDRAADDQRTRIPNSVGGLLVCARDTFVTAGMLDERFTGWGFQDVAFEQAAATLVAPSRRHHGPLWHLWHPHDPWADTTHPTYQADSEMCERYYVAARDRSRMRALVHGR